MNELVSIIIPAYNAEQWIRDTIGSALNQTWPKKEIIVVDDGSTDNTFAIAKQLESKQVKVIAQQNKGASAARNKGLTLAQGSYIQWLDADDLLAPDKIMNQLRSAEKGEDSRTMLTSSFGTFYFCRERAKVNPTVLWQDLLPIDWLLNKFNENAWMNPAVWLVSRKLTEQAGPWNERLVRDNDGEYLCRVVAASEQVKFVREGWSYYRVCNLNSLSCSLSDKACESLVLSLHLCTQHLLSMENSERTRIACSRYLQSFVQFLDPEKEEYFSKLNALASEMGGHLVVPPLRWRYDLLKSILGWKTTKKFMIGCARAKFKAVTNFDRILFGVMYKSRRLTYK